MTGTMVPRPHPPAVRRGRRRLYAMLALLFVPVAALPALPWLMGIVTEVQHSYTPGVPEENKGTYLVTDDGAMQLYAWRIDPGEFPSDAPVVAAERVRHVVVVARAFIERNRYVLYDLDEERRIDWVGAMTDGRTLTLRWEGDLDEGRYLLIVPTDSSFGGITRPYFRLGDVTEEAP